MAKSKKRKMHPLIKALLEASDSSALKVMDNDEMARMIAGARRGMVGLSQSEAELVLLAATWMLFERGGKVEITRAQWEGSGLHHDTVDVAFKNDVVTLELQSMKRPKQ